MVLIDRYTLLRQLDPSLHGERWLASDPNAESETRCVMHLIDVGTSSDTARTDRLVEAARATGRLKSCHILTPNAAGLTRDGRVWLVTRCDGGGNSFISLDRLLFDKGGSLAPSEAKYAVEQLLTATISASDQGALHGPIKPAEVLVDRRGRLSIELYALANAFGQIKGSPEEITRREVRSAAELGFLLIYGVPPHERRAMNTRLMARAPRRWGQWFDRALADDGCGFDTASQALLALHEQGARAALVPAIATENHS